MLLAEPQEGLGAQLDPEAQHESETSEERRARRLLALGAAVGLLMASYGILSPAETPSAPMPADAVAMVNGEVLRKDAYERLVAGFESDSRNPVDDEIRRHILDRMIEEELLVQRALALGLAEVDRRIRGDLASSLIDSVVSDAEEREPSIEELRDFYAEQAPFFSRAGRYRVEQILFRVPHADAGDAAQENAQAASAALDAGMPFAEVAAQYGDAEISPVPDALLPAMKLREYLGPTLVDTLLSMKPEQVSPPLRSGVGFHILRLVERQAPSTPPFEEIESQVYHEYVRRSGDQALRNYLDQLRRESDVVIALPPAN